MRIILKGGVWKNTEDEVLKGETDQSVARGQGV